MLYGERLSTYKRKVESPSPQIRHVGLAFPWNTDKRLNNSTWLYFALIRIQHQEERLSQYSDIPQDLSVRCELASSHGQNKRNALSLICLQNTCWVLLRHKDTQFLGKTLYFKPNICQLALFLTKNPINHTFLTIPSLWYQDIFLCLVHDKKYIYLIISKLLA